MTFPKALIDSSPLQMVTTAYITRRSFSITCNHCSRPNACISHEPTFRKLVLRNSRDMDWFTFLLPDERGSIFLLLSRLQCISPGQFRQGSLLWGTMHGICCFSHSVFQERRRNGGHEPFLTYLHCINVSWLHHCRSPAGSISVCILVLEPLEEMCI